MLSYKTLIQRNRGSAFPGLNMGVFEIFNNNLPDFCDFCDESPSSCYKPNAPNFSNIAIDIKDEGDNWIITADVPGVSKENINISIENEQLTISCEREIVNRNDGENDGYFCSERCSGKSFRIIDIPGLIEEKNIKAVLKDGVLTLTIARSKEVIEKKRTVEILEG